jgi:S1-C subfamily serine protease
MTSSQWLDIAVVAIAFVAALSGWRSGALGSLMSLVGVILGGVAGVLLAPHLVGQLGGRTKLFAMLFLILALVVIGEIAGVVVGRAVRGAIRHGGARFVDSLVGVVLQVLVVLAAAWLLATPLTSSSQPNLAAAVRGSKVLTHVDAVVPPWLKSTVQKRLSALWDSSGLPDVLDQYSRTRIANVDPPDQSLASSAVVTIAQPSVVKVHGTAPGCHKELEGSGFVVAPNRVMSNAHVVAGADTVTVESDGQPYDATVVSYDPEEDISILQVPDLPAEPLKFAEKSAAPGADALVLGYPGGGVFAATPARIRETIELNGPDIYRNTTVIRKVYTIRGVVKQGNSGGPLINRSGEVLGVVFGAAVDDNDTGFVLTADEVARQLAKIGNTARVPTGVCVG